MWKSKEVCLFKAQWADVTILKQCRNKAQMIGNNKSISPKMVSENHRITRVISEKKKKSSGLYVNELWKIVCIDHMNV